MKKGKMNVILTDDDFEEHVIFSDAVKNVNEVSQILCFDKGDSLLEYLKSIKEEELDILFLDLNMPAKSGLECLKEIRAEEKFKNLPIAIYSTSSAEEDKRETFANGATIYVTKPETFTKLKEVLKQIMEVDWKSHFGKKSRKRFVYTL